MMIAEKFAANEGTMGAMGGMSGGAMGGIMMGGTIGELARGAGVSEPTVIRSVRGLGYRGYREF